MRQINFTPKAVKQLNKIPKDYQGKIKSAVIELRSFPECKGDIKKLQGMMGYRLRGGRYRVIFDAIGTIIEIQEVKKRDDNTYK